ncbi:MAG: murein hydrolase activator EnvC family protein [Hyphomicrobium sp.]
MARSQKKFEKKLHPAFVHVLAVLMTFSTAIDLFAQNEAPRDAGQGALETQKNRQNSNVERANTIQRNVASLEADRAKINSRLVETAKLIQKSESHLTQIETRLKDLETQEKKVRENVTQRHYEISKLLGALQRMGRNPPPVIVTEREDALKMVRSAMLLASLYPGMRKEAQQLVDTLNHLTKVMDDIKIEASKVKEETIQLEDLRSRLASLVQTKRQSITERQAELKKVTQAAEDISKGVTDLNELIRRLDATVAENTELKGYEAHKNAVLENSQEPKKPSEKGASTSPSNAAPTPLIPSPQKGGEAVATPSVGDQEKERKVVELSPSLRPESPNSAGRLQPAIPFQSAKAKLPLPASGKKVLNYGEKTKYGSNSKGIVLETRYGAQVTAPSDGWIVYAGEFRSYGKLLIINAGGGYHILLAGLSQIDVQPGQFVLAAEPVGLMSSSKKETTDTSNSAPVLYVEFRKDGQPIDPNPWWIVTNQKAEG